jgi:hypothetical protein
VTRDERATLDIFLGEWREFRQDDRIWKIDLEQRVRRMEEFVISEEAQDERARSRGVSRRAYVAATISAIGIVVSIILGIANALA